MPNYYHTSTDGYDITNTNILGEVYSEFYHGNDHT